jgi:hypothetical protein
MKIKMVIPHIHYNFKVCREHCIKPKMITGKFEIILIIQVLLDIWLIALVVKIL